jgi:hypothetical protein
MFKRLFVENYVPRVLNAFRIRVKQDVGKSMNVIWQLVKCNLHSMMSGIDKG